MFFLLIFSDIRRDCSFEHIAVEENDLIILASDGLWNVLENRQLQRIITQNRDQVCACY